MIQDVIDQAGHDTAAIWTLNNAITVLGLFVPVAVATIFVWHIPRSRKQRDVAIDLYKLFYSEGMCEARRIAWIYLHKVDGNSKKSKDEELARRIRLIWKWSLEMGDRPEVADDLANLMAVRRVLEFFAAAEQCLVATEVNRPLLRALLGYAFARWSEDNIERLIRANPPEATLPPYPITHPGWLNGLPEFRKLCDLEPPATINLRK